MLHAAVQDFCTQQGVEQTYWIGYSGGLDSHVLLVLLSELRQHLPLILRAVHIHHGISPHASDWAQHCQQVCRDLRIDYVEQRVQVIAQPGDSLEAVARKQRYQAFAAVMQPGDVLLTAHQQDDQAETLLLQLLRGAGLKGLAAMPAMQAFAQGFHGRPLLSVARDALRAYANAQHLTWIEDESNTDQRLTRNFLRHELVSLLKTRWPSVSAVLARSARHCAEATQLLDEYVLLDSRHCQGTHAYTLSVQKLVQLSPARQRHVLRYWLQQQGVGMPDTKKMATIQSNVLTAAKDRHPCVEWGGVTLRRYRDELYLIPMLLPHDPMQTRQWALEQPLELAGIGLLQATRAQGSGLRAEVSALSVRFRQGGEWLDMAQRGRHRLKTLMQDWQVLPWMRDRVPLIYVGDQLVGVVGYAWDQRYLAGEGEEGWHITQAPLSG